jgi:hypothetical protein
MVERHIVAPSRRRRWGKEPRMWFNFTCPATVATTHFTSSRVQRCSCVPLSFSSERPW